jgi:hypothetical protein
MMTYAQDAFTGAKVARPITAPPRRIARELEARLASQVDEGARGTLIADKGELYRVAIQARSRSGLARVRARRLAT